MRGSFVLSPLEVDLVVPPKRPGVYGLSDTHDRIQVVRRAATSLREALRNSFGQFKYFWFDVALSAEDAFRQECLVFHDLKPVNEPAIPHPVAPAESNWRCPVCKK